MATLAAPVVEIVSLLKDYRGLRPLRLTGLSVREGERVAVGGIDATAAEVLVNLINGAILPDAGHVRVFGEDTASITDEDAWLASLERFGIVTPRAVLLDGSTLLQNLALPFTLDIDPVPEAVRLRVVSVSERVGLTPAHLPLLASEVSADVRVRVHLARSLALHPRVLLFEHPTVGVAPEAVAPLAHDAAQAVEAEGVAALVVSNDDTFCDIVAQRRYRLNAATGRLSSVGRLRRWFGA
jgi:phospholipid/cholesterol/gamma-HCH transport system ATP-binding protein